MRLEPLGPEHLPGVPERLLRLDHPLGVVVGLVIGALVVVNGALDQLAVRLPPDHVARWQLAWDSVWEHPREERLAAIAGCLHAGGGESVVLEPLSMRVYVRA